MVQFKITRANAEYAQGAIDVLRDSFFIDEKVCNCVNLLTDSPLVDVGSEYKCTKGSVQLEALCLDVLKDDISLVAVDQDTNQVLGVAFNKIQVKPPPGEKGYFEIFAENNITDSSALALVDFMIAVDGKFDIFEYCKTECGLELMFLGVKNSVKGLGIGRALIEETIRLGQQYDGFPKPQFVCAIYSSRFSQKAGERAGMECVLEIPYTDYEYKGRKYSEVVGPDHPVAVLSVKKL